MILEVISVHATTHCPPDCRRSCADVVRKLPLLGEVFIQGRTAEQIVDVPVPKSRATSWCSFGRWRSHFPDMTLHHGMGQGYTLNRHPETARFCQPSEGCRRSKKAET